MALILNVVWVVCGGLVAALCWLLAALLMAITLIGLPWARACLTIAGYTLWPFGREAIGRDVLTGRRDVGTGPLGLVGNVIWFLLAGWILAIVHVTAAVACALTIIGIPFAFAHLKLAGIALFPIGQTVVAKQVAEAARRRAAMAEVDALRSR
jgi:uncharacterized membrane protein YccF (DUF307 family)